MLGVQAIAHGFDGKIGKRCVERACASGEGNASAVARGVFGDQFRRIGVVGADQDCGAVAADGISHARGGVQRIKCGGGRRACDAEFCAGAQQCLRAGDGFDLVAAFARPADERARHGEFRTRGKRSAHQGRIKHDFAVAHERQNGFREAFVFAPGAEPFGGAGERFCDVGAFGSVDHHAGFDGRQDHAWRPCVRRDRGCAHVHFQVLGEIFGHPSLPEPR